MQQLLHGLHKGLPVYHQQEQQRSDLPDGLDGAVYKAQQALDAKLLDEAVNSFLRTLSDDASCRLPVFDGGLCYSNCISPACRVAQ